MNKNEAIKILMAVACCSMTELHCCDCPMYDKNKVKCCNWSNEEVVEAVLMLDEMLYNEITDN